MLCVAVPAAWDARGCQIMREAAIEAYVPAVCLLMTYESSSLTKPLLRQKLIVNSSVQVSQEIRIGEIACTSSRTFCFSILSIYSRLSKLTCLITNDDYVLTFSEPEAAAVHCAHLTNLHQLRPSQNFMICDAGGGTVVRPVFFFVSL